MIPLIARPATHYMFRLVPVSRLRLSLAYRISHADISQAVADSASDMMKTARMQQSKLKALVFLHQSELLLSRRCISLRFRSETSTALTCRGGNLVALDELREADAENHAALALGRIIRRQPDRCADCEEQSTQRESAQFHDRSVVSYMCLSLPCTPFSIPV